MDELASAIRGEARRLGFSTCAIAPVGEAPHADFFADWLAQGRAGEMTYLEQYVARRRNPTLLAKRGTLPLRSILVLGVDYHQFDLPPAVRDDPSRGVIAKYAWGEDYHELVRPLLYDLDAFIRRHSGRASLGKALVDTGPVLERDWAATAGLGFIGKHCCTIVPGAGSWHLLAVLIVPEVLATSARETLPLARAQPARPATCGQCTRCLDACPTGAFLGPYDLDPRRCIAYWTIEARAPLPPELRPSFGNRIFGCDICQEVCPYNRRLPARTPLLAALAARPERVAPPLLEGFDPATPYWLDEAAFAARFHRSPILRAGRAGMLRNVCVALGNWAAPETLPALRLAVADPEPAARGHAAWALGQVRRRHAGMVVAAAATALLAAAKATETEAQVLAELAATD